MAAIGKNYSKKQSRVLLKEKTKSQGKNKISGNQTELVEWRIKNSLERLVSRTQRSRVSEHQKVSKHLIPATEKRQGNELSLQPRDNIKGSTMSVLERKTA